MASLPLQLKGGTGHGGPHNPSTTTEAEAEGLLHEYETSVGNIGYVARCQLKNPN